MLAFGADPLGALSAVLLWTQKQYSGDKSTRISSRNPVTKPEILANTKKIGATHSTPESKAPRLPRKLKTRPRKAYVSVDTQNRPYIDT